MSGAEYGFEGNKFSVPQRWTPESFAEWINNVHAYAKYGELSSDHALLERCGSPSFESALSSRTSPERISLGCDQEQQASARVIGMPPPSQRLNLSIEAKACKSHFSGMSESDDSGYSSMRGDGQSTSEYSSTPARNHPLYDATLSGDGFYHCPFADSEPCGHEPKTFKSDYDKYIDSHLKTFRCRHSQCYSLQFSSAANLLHHERELHEKQEYEESLCEYPPCNRSIPGNGFRRSYNCRDHMSRCHGWVDHNPQQDKKRRFRTTGANNSTASENKTSSKVLSERQQIASLKDEWAKHKANLEELTRNIAPDGPLFTIALTQINNEVQTLKRIELEWAKLTGRAFLEGSIKEEQEPDVVENKSFPLRSQPTQRAFTIEGPPGHQTQPLEIQIEPTFSSAVDHHDSTRPETWDHAAVETKAADLTRITSENHSNTDTNSLHDHDSLLPFRIDSPRSCHSLSNVSHSSDKSTETDAELVLTIDERRQQLIQRLMAYFFELFATCSRSAKVCQAAADSGHDSNPQASSLSKTKCSTSAGKRKIEQTGDGGQPEGRDDDDDKSHKRPRTNLEVATQDAPSRLACPFFKRAPRRYRSERSCTGPGFTTVHRLKEHIYRYHRHPIHCPRCCETFISDQSRDQHQRQDPPCQNKPIKVFDGIDKKQEVASRSKSRKKNDDTNVTDGDKWKAIYMILFPYDDPEKIPSAYYEYDSIHGDSDQDNSILSELERYEKYLRQDLPYELHRELERRLDTLLGNTEESLRSEIPLLFRDIQVRLFRKYIEEHRETVGQSTVNNNLFESGKSASSVDAEKQNEGPTGHLETQLDLSLQDLLAPVDPLGVPWPENYEWFNDIEVPWFNGEIFDLKQTETTDSGYKSIPSNGNFSQEGPSDIASSKEG